MSRYSLPALNSNYGTQFCKLFIKIYLVLSRPTGVHLNIRAGSTFVVLVWTVHCQFTITKAAEECVGVCSHFHKPTHVQNENIGKNFSILAKNKINSWSILNIFYVVFLNFLNFTFLLFVIIIVVKREQRHSVLSDETGNRSYTLRYQVE